MATFKKPTIQEIYNTIINDYKTRANIKIPILKRALVKCFAYAIAGIISSPFYIVTYKQLSSIPPLDTIN